MLEEVLVNPVDPVVLVVQCFQSDLECLADQCFRLDLEFNIDVTLESMYRHRYSLGHLVREPEAINETNKIDLNINDCII
jgi:hypothetical protein